MRRPAHLLAILLAIASSTLSRADTLPTDYDHARQLDDRTRNLLPRAHVDPHWSPDSSLLWYTLPDSPTCTVITTATGAREQRPKSPDFPVAPSTTIPTTDPAPPDSPNNSPDGHFAAIVRNHNLLLIDRHTHDFIKLTTDATPDDSYREDALFWSPDSSKLVALKTKAGQKHPVSFIESSPTDQLQPKLHTIDYLKPGDKIPLTKPHLFSIVDRQEIPAPDALFPNPWSLDDIRWNPDSSRFTFLYNQRGHQILRLLSVNATTGQSTPIIDEQSKTFIDYNGKFFIHYLPDTHELLWMSERDGWNHLYLIDAATGSIKNQITAGDWVVRGVDDIDPDHRQLTFHCGGIFPDQDPYYLHYCRINFDGTRLVHLTTANGTHKLAYSPDHRFYIDTFSRADLPPTTELHRTDDASLLCPLESPDLAPLLATAWKTPEQFTAKARDNTTDIYGLIYRPTTYDPAKKYPVIEDIYAGPQDSFVPKEFQRVNEMMFLAELGFIVVKIDGMGTSNRSKAFHDVCWRNLGYAGFPDRIAWMKAAAAKDPAMDLSRVGIYGVSAGAQSSLRALEAHGDFYKAAVSDCGCHDNRMDKIWWNELFMGYPVGPWYAEQSNVVNANKMNGKLLLVVGELDSNVDPASTMQVVNALIKANKDFELLVVPGANHGAGESPYGKRRRADFFLRTLHP